MEKCNLDNLKNLPGPILVTGHTGFKGTWLALLLEKLDLSVAGYSLAPERNSLFNRCARSGCIPEIFGDIRDFAKLDNFIQTIKPSAIIHLAAQSLVLESYRIPRDTFEVNIMGTVNVLQSAFGSPSVQAIVVVTTDKVYKNNNSGIPFIEADALEGKDPYSASKVGAESVVTAWQQIAKVAGGPKVITARAGNVIGGGDLAKDRILPELIRAFSNGEVAKLRNPNSTRPWLHVLDPLIGYLFALNSIFGENSFEAVNFGPNTETLKVIDVANLAAAQWPFPVKIDSFQGNIIPVAMEALQLQLDSNFARETLDWRPTWSSKEAVIATVAWWDKVLNCGALPLDACADDIEKVLYDN